jgi:hypothetical protein
MILGILCLLAIPITASAGGFAVGPPSISVTIPAYGEGTTSIYITSDFDGELIVGVEDIPFRVEPETIQVSSTYVQKEVELTFYGDPSISEGTYSGKVTLLAYSGNNVAHGVKIKADVTQISQIHPGQADEGNGGNSFVDTIKDNYIAVILGVMVIVALAVGIGIGRMRRHET